MPDRYVHVAVPDDVVTADSRSAVLMVIKALVDEHLAAGREAQMVVGQNAIRIGHGGGNALELMRGGLPRTRLERTGSVLQGRLLGHRPSTASAFYGLRKVNEARAVIVHNIPEGIREASGEVPRVLYLHNDALRHYSRREVRTLSAATDLVVCVSESLSDRLPASLKARRAVVLNGVDGDVFFPKVREGSTLPTILFVGRVVPEKGVHTLLDAAAQLKHLDFRVRIVGSGSSSSQLSSYERRLRRQVAGTGLESRVTFERSLPRARIPDAMRASDIMVVPSIWADPCPLVVAEGLASGLPMIAAESGGIPELGGGACRYHRPGDPQSLAAHLEDVLSDEFSRRQLGLLARARGLELTWAAAEARLVAAIDEATNR